MKTDPPVATASSAADAALPRRAMRWLGAHSPLLLIAVLIVVGGSWAFVALLDEVQEGETERFDSAVLSFVSQYRGERYELLENVGRDITALGGIAVLTLITLAVLGYLLIVRKFAAFWFVLVATTGGLIINTLLKWLIDRERPQLFDHLDVVYTKSFPSGHSMLSATVYLTLGTLLARFVPGNATKAYILCIALAITGLVGLSRIYLTVHWPTDVLAGWTAGLVWAILCWAVARSLQRRGRVERDVEGT